MKSLLKVLCVGALPFVTACVETTGGGTYSALPPSALYTKASMYASSVDANVFEVTGRPGAVKHEYWCAAGDYARRSLGKGWNDRIYVVRGFGKGVFNGAPSSVLFTLNPQAAGVTPLEATLILDTLAVGYSKSVSDAESECARYFLPII